MWLLLGCGVKPHKHKGEQTMSNKIPVAVLAATGAVGQRFVSLLADHPWFELTVVTASDRSTGKTYGEAANWVIPGDVPASAADLIVQETAPNLDDARIVFSALPSGPAREVEPQFADAGYVVCTNASAYRMDPLVPLLIPEINPDHIGLIGAQKKERGWSGYIVANTNCSTSGVIFPMKALHDAFGMTTSHVVTMQAISGAGYPGVPSLDILDNIIPYIGNEEDKVETEPLKLMGTLAGDHIEFADMQISAQTNRVPVIDGHLAALSMGFRTRPSVEEATEALRNFRAVEGVQALPSAPEPPIIVREELDRPQPRRDRDAGNGAAVSVGRVQACNLLDVKLVSLVHNTLRGAATGSVLNAEWLVAEGYVDGASVPG